MSQRVCRLCLQTVNENFQEIGETLEKILKLDISISEENVMCMGCVDNLEVFLNLKSACVDAKEKTLVLDELRNNVGLDTVNAENVNNPKSCTMPKDEIRCNFCTNLSAKESIISLHESKESMCLVDMLEKYIPELNLSNSKESLTCETCLDRMQCVSRFLQNCLYVEEEIRKYSEIEGTNGKGQVELWNVHQFIIKSTLRFEGACHVNELGQTHVQTQETYIIKAEDEIKSEIEEDEPEPIIETEHVDIKLEQSSCDRFQESTADVELDEDPLEIPLYKCAMCQFETKYRGRFKRHVTRHKKSMITTGYKCKMCTYKTTCKDHLDSHILVHKNRDDIKAFKCEICAFEARYRYEVKKHMLSHADDSEVILYYCEMCTFKTKYKQNLIQHNLTHKSCLEVTSYHCEMCPFETKYKQNFMQHKLTHKSASEMTMFKCKMCTFETKHKCSLRRHMLIHKIPSEITMLKCGLCTFETKRKQGLNKHMFHVHNNSSEITLYKCEFCTYETKDKQYLAQHKMTHKCSSEMTKFKCEICTFETRRRGSLMNHMVMHKSPAETTMFKCELCTFETKRKFTLANHLLTHKDVSTIMFKCRLCKFETRYKYYLNQHKLKHKNSPRVRQAGVNLKQK